MTRYVVEAHYVKKKQARNRNEESVAQHCFVDDALPQLPVDGFGLVRILSSFLKLTRSTERDSQNEERNQHNEEGVSSYPEVLDEALPEERTLFLARLEIVEESVERELNQDRHKQHRQPQREPNQEEVPCGHCVDLVVRCYFVSEQLAEGRAATILILNSSQNACLKHYQPRWFPLLESLLSLREVSCLSFRFLEPIK